MPWTNIPTFTVGQVLTSSTMNNMRSNANIGHLICTSANRPVAPDTGTMIYETDTGRLLVYVGTGWAQVSTPALAVEYLVVAGGGQGGGSQGTSIASGGGGAGGMLTNRNTGTRFSIATGVPYSVVVGAGGANSTVGFVLGASGGSSSFSTISCSGGGGGGTWGIAPSAGGAGGGAGENAQGLDGAAGVAGQGYRGGNDHSYDSGGPSIAAGGGGAGGSGYDAVSQIAGIGGSGGDGRASDITGSWVLYAGGGGGAGNGGGGKGGQDGGGYGQGGTTGTGGNGTAGTGAGGGGSLTNANEASQRGGFGGSGIVVIRYPSALPAATVTGSPTITTSGDDRVYSWTSTGTWSVTF